MVFGDRWQIFRISLRHGCRAIPIAWTMVEGKGLVQVNKLKSMFEKVQHFMKRYVKQVTLLADAGFRDCDWAQLCRELGWNYAIRIACNTYITLPDGTSDRLDNWVPVNRNRYFQNVLLTCAKPNYKPIYRLPGLQMRKGSRKWWQSSVIKSLAGRACESMQGGWALNRVSATINPAASIWPIPAYSIPSALIISYWPCPSPLSGATS